MIDPAQKLFRIIKNTTFWYRFQYLAGTPISSSPVNLTGYSATWAITWTKPTPGSTTYNVVAGAPSGTTSGIYFGGDNHDLTTGIIDLIISQADTNALPWTNATHQFAITDTSSIRLELFLGGIAVTGVMP